MDRLRYSLMMTPNDSFHALRRELPVSEAQFRSAVWRQIAHRKVLGSESHRDLAAVFGALLPRWGLAAALICAAGVVTLALQDRSVDDRATATANALQLQVFEADLHSLPAVALLERR